MKLKYKVCFQTNTKIWDNITLLTKKKKKWNLLKRQNKINKKKNLNLRPRSLKQLFKKRLYSKQQLKNFYGGILEHQLKNYYNNFSKQNSKNNLENFIILLESRLDIVLYRSGISSTIFHGKQLINHGKININGNKIKSNNTLLQDGDIISFNGICKNNINKNINYLLFNKKLNVLIFLRRPLFNEIRYPFFLNIPLIIEHLKLN